MTHRVIRAAAIAATTSMLTYALGALLDRRRRRKREAARALHTWEGEGGNLRPAEQAAVNAGAGLHA